MTDQVKIEQPLREAADSRALTALARLGLAARATIYLLIGALAIDLAVGRHNHETDQRGALNEVASKPGGLILLVLIAVGFAGYALWRLSEAALGVHGESGVAARIQSGFRGLVYAIFAVGVVLVITGSGRRKSQAQQQQELSARIMQHSGGRLLVGAVGVVVVVVGLGMAFRGFRTKFLKRLEVGRMSQRTRKVVTALGSVGSISRGVIFGLVGVLTIDAAATFDPGKARGIDGALRALAAQPYGRVLLVLAAAGLITFALYAFAEARWRRT